MKIKPIISGENKEYYDNIRFNHNIENSHKKAIHGIENQDKRDYAATVIYALMSISGYVDEVIQNYENDEPINIINSVADIAKNKIGNISLSNNSMNYQINDIITFDKDYLVLDVILKDDSTYLYLINNDELDDDIAIIKVKNNNYLYIEDDDEFDFILNKIFIDFKDDIIKLLAIE